MECHGVATALSRHVVMVMKREEAGQNSQHRQHSSKPEMKCEMYAR